MRAPRYAHWRIVPALAVSMGLGPVASAAAPATTEPPATVAGEDTEPEPSEGSEPDAEPAETEPATGETPAETEPEPTGETPPPTEPEPESPTEPTPTPQITVRPRPISAASDTTNGLGDTPPNEVVVDPRRRHSDERILLRAGLLSFGVAGAALVPTVVGLHQAAYARRVLDRLDTPSELGARAEVESYERSMNRMALLTGAITVSSVVAGAVLVGLGARRPQRAETTVAPMAGPTGAGVMLRGRF